MILSFHPCFSGDHFRLCAGREPDAADLAAIRAADAVVLPQGCRESLCTMARQHCDHVFPDYAARFAWPGKLGQIRLFREMKVPHPKTESFRTIGEYRDRYGAGDRPPDTGFPAVFKFDWGGEGDNVFCIGSHNDLRAALERAVRYEQTGQKGFLLQRYVPGGERTLRVTVIGNTYRAYWRQPEETGGFYATVSRGGRIDQDADPLRKDRAITAVRDFCRNTGINLAGFDLIFSRDDPAETPLFLEINYYFGRRGLGGSEAFYDLLLQEIHQWISDIGLRVPPADRMPEDALEDTDAGHPSS